MTTMKRAHEIRKEAAEKWDCETSEIIFSLCLKMAWTEAKKENNMTEITKGSKKQIAWAEAIKAKALKEIRKEAAAKYEDREGEELDMNIFDEYRNKLETCEDARWFIDHARHDHKYGAFYWMEKGEDEEDLEMSRERLGLI